VPDAARLGRLAALIDIVSESRPAFAREVERQMSQLPQPHSAELEIPRLRGRLLAALTGHTRSVLCGAWGQVGDQPVLATGGDDGTVRLWEVIEDRPVPRLPRYGSDVTLTPDQLARTADAAAVAELVTAKTATGRCADRTAATEDVS
jgi:WD40 repeat protein